MTDKINKPVSDRIKYRTLLDLYKFYRYKTYNIDSSTVPIPYFPKSEISTHPYALTYKKWREVVNVYIEVVLEELTNGFDYKIPHGMGNLFLYKVPLTVVNGEIRNPKYTKIINKYLDGWIIKLRWNKRLSATSRKVRFKNKTMFSIYMLKNVFKTRVIYPCGTDKSRIYRYPTINRK